MRTGPFFVAALIAAVAPAVVSVARADEEDTGFFNRLEQSAGQRTIHASGGKTVGVSEEVYAANRALIDGLQPGDEFRFTRDRQGQLATIRRAKERGAAGRETFTGRFGSISPANAGRYWLKLQDVKTEFQVKEEVYQRCARILAFLKPGMPVRLAVEDGWVIDVAQSKSGREIDPVLEERLQLSQAGDVVSVRGEPFVFISKNLIEVKLRPRVPNTNPPEWVKEGVTTLQIDELRAEDFVNDKAGERRAQAAQTGDQTVADIFTAERIQVGDTVGIDLDEGQIVGLGEGTYDLLVWRNEEWAFPPVQSQRATVKAVSSVALASRLVVALQGSEVTARVSRRRLGREGGLQFEVELSHALVGQVIVGAKLKLLLSDIAGMSADAPPTWTEEVAVPVVFEGRPIKLKFPAGQEGALDGRVELVIPPNGVVPVASPQAKAHVLAAIEQAGRDNEALRRAYVAAGANADPELAALLVSRVQVTTADVAPAHREALIAGLDAFGPVATKVILDILVANDRTLEVIRLDRGALKSVALPRDDSPLAYKRRLVGLLGELEQGVRGDAGRRLLDLDRVRDDMAEPIQAAFSRHPADAAVVLLDLATSTGVASTEDEQARAQKAAGLLQNLGSAVLPDVLRELRRRELPPAQVDELTKAAEAPGADGAHAVSQAIAAVIDDAGRRKRALLDQQVERGRALASEQKWAEAAPLLRKVLLEAPDHAGALELTPSVLVKLADQLAATDRAAAGDLYAEAWPLLKGAEQSRAKTALAELQLVALTEELEEVVVREGANPLARRVKAAVRGQVFQGTEVVSGWVRMPLERDQLGYVRAKVLRQDAGADKWSIADDFTPYDVIEEEATKIGELSPTAAAGLNELRGKLCAREAKAKYEAGDFRGALPFFSKARELAPTDERLSLYGSCWAQAYKTHLATVGGIVLLVLGIAVFQAFAKPKAVKFEGEYKHYGANRTERERDLDVEGGVDADGKTMDVPQPTEGGDQAPPAGPAA